jgi:hypothetical protein
MAGLTADIVATGVAATKVFAGQRFVRIHRAIHYALGPLGAPASPMGPGGQ